MSRIITDTKAVETAIDSIARRSAKLDDDIQIAALSAANHAHLHGDITLINRLYKAMGKGVRHVALTGWMLEFAPVAANTDAASKKDKPFVWMKEKRVTEALEAHMAKADAADAQWFMFKPSADPDAVFDFKAFIVRTMKKLDTANVSEEDAELVAMFRKTFGTQEVEA